MATGAAVIYWPVLYVCEPLRRPRADESDEVAHRMGHDDLTGYRRHDASPRAYGLVPMDSPLNSPSTTSYLVVNTWCVPRVTPGSYLRNLRRA